MRKTLVTLVLVASIGSLMSAKREWNGWWPGWHRHIPDIFVSPAEAAIVPEMSIICSCGGDNAAGSMPQRYFRILTAAGDVPTVPDPAEIDAARLTCHRHFADTGRVTTFPGTLTEPRAYQPGWESCATIEEHWNSRQQADREQAERDKVDGVAKALKGAQ